MMMNSMSMYRWWENGMKGSTWVKNKEQYRFHVCQKSKQICSYTRCNVQITQLPQEQDGFQLLTLLLNSASFLDRLIKSGIEFHNLGAWYLKELMPWVIVLICGSCNICIPLVSYSCSLKLNVFARIFGLIPFTYLKHSISTSCKHVVSSVHNIYWTVTPSCRWLRGDIIHQGLKVKK